MSALAFIVAATLAQAGALRSDLALRGGGAGRSVVALSAWDKGGSQDWGAGIPSPTIDCAAVGTSSSASLQCSGATPSFAGPVQTAAGSPWWYRGDSAVRPAIALNGSTDWWNLGNAVDANGGGFVICAQVRADSVSGVAYVVSKYVSGGYQFSIHRNGVTWFLGQYRTDGSGQALTLGSVALGSHQTLCGSLTAVGAGTSVLRGNLDGAATSRSDASIPDSSSAVVAVGSDSTGGGKWTGSIRRVAIWTGADAPTSAAQLAQMVATQWGLAADKPSGTVATHARTDSTLCCPFSDAECYWVGYGAPCIHAPTYSGWASGGTVAGGIEVYGPGANASLQSQALAAGYNLNSGAASSDVSAFADGSVTMDRFTANRVNGPAYQLVAVSSSVGPFTFSAWARSPSGASNASVSVACAAGNRATCSCGSSSGICTVANTGATDCSAWAPTVDSAPTRIWVTLTCASANTGVYAGLQGGKMATEGGIAADFGGMQLTPTAHPVPYRSTTATAYAGIASTATTLTGVSSLLNKDRFALGISATATGNWATVNTGLLQWGGAYGAANTVSVYTDASAKISVEVYDGAAGWRRWTADAALSGTGQKRIGVAFNSGTIRVLVDDVEISGTMSGAGTGLLGALPSTSLVIGTTGSSILRGLDAKVCQANDVPGLKRCLR